MEDMIMSDFTITDAMKQAVITRLATINSATSLLSLINGRPAKVTVDEVLTLAERIEQWAWRDLREDQPPQSPTPKRPDTMTPQTRPAAKPLKANGHGQRQGDATENQINAIFAIGKAKGYSSEEIEAWVQEQRKKGTAALNKQEASQLIGDLNAM
jgi:hypothetical protein